MSDFTERLTRAHTGDEKAREELILENRPLVYAVVKRFEYRVPRENSACRGAHGWMHFEF